MTFMFALTSSMMLLCCVAGEEVSWVQCDKCELWFHMICIGVAEDEIDENEDYICFQCRNPRAAATAGDACAL